MDVISRCALPAAGRVWRDASGGWVMSVICKATFTLAPGPLLLANDQQPIVDSEQPMAGHPASVFAPSDLAPRKPMADVVLVGEAHASGASATEPLEVRLQYATIDKAIDVWPDRKVKPDGTLWSAAPFSRASLAYERAAGGAGTENPAGMSLLPDAHGAVSLPNLLAHGATYARGRALAPIGFGPIRADWPSRARRDGAWSRAGWADERLPSDADFAYFNVAPADQQVPALRPGERLVLSNLVRGHARLEATLPSLQLAALAARAEGAEEAVAMKMDTLFVDTTREIVCLTYRGELPVTRRDEPGRITISLREAPFHELQRAATIEVMPASEGQLFTEVPQQVRRRAASPAIAPSSPAPSVAHESVVADGYPPPEPLSPWAARPTLASGQLESKWAAPTQPQPVFVALPVAPATPPAVEPPPAMSQRARDEAIDLVFVDRASMPRIRRVPAWKPLLVALADRSIEDDEDDPTASTEAEAVEDRRDILELLANAEPLDLDGLYERAAAAIRSDGRYLPPIVLLAGELSTPFDEVATLKATLTAAAPFAAADEPLRESMLPAEELLTRAWRTSSPATVDGFTSRIRLAFAAPRRTLPAQYLETQAERALLEARDYQKRNVLGDTKLRALLAVTSAPKTPPVAVAAYLPMACAKQLPLAARFTVRAIARVHLPVDPLEPGYALEILALGRVCSPPRRP